MTFYLIGKMFFEHVPILRPILRKGQMVFRPMFSGWGMTTLHECPNTSKSDDIFNQAFVHVKKFDKSNKHSYDDKTVDGALWRFWIISFAARQAALCGSSKEQNFVECGVGNGYSAFFAQRQLSGKNYRFHLYDSWGVMKPEQLTQSEKFGVGQYKDLDFEITKQNLKEFENHQVFHKGYIPETLDESAPETISYLHIDLNAANPTKDVLVFFLPRLAKNGIILFDDYGSPDYMDTRQTIDNILESYVGNLLKFPTGQAVWFHGSDFCQCELNPARIDPAEKQYGETVFDS